MCRKVSNNSNNSHQSLAISYFFFNDTATTEIYTLSLHDALPILTLTASRTYSTAPSASGPGILKSWRSNTKFASIIDGVSNTDRKSTRLNSSHSQISYAVFCLKKKMRDWDKF